MLLYATMSYYWSNIICIQVIRSWYYGSELIVFLFKCTRVFDCYLKSRALDLHPRVIEKNSNIYDTKLVLLNLTLNIF